MGPLIVFFLLWLKHAFLANAVDLGYSESRREHTLAVSWLYLSYQILLEAIGTLLLLTGITFYLNAFSMWRWESLLLAEGLGQVVTWSMERHAALDNTFTVHVIAEIAYLALIAVLAIALYPF